MGNGTPALKSVQSGRGTTCHARVRSRRGEEPDRRRPCRYISRQRRPWQSLPKHSSAPAGLRDHYHAPTSPLLEEGRRDAVSLRDRRDHRGAQPSAAVRSVSRTRIVLGHCMVVAVFADLAHASGRQDARAHHMKLYLRSCVGPLRRRTDAGQWRRYNLSFFSLHFAPESATEETAETKGSLPANPVAGAETWRCPVVVCSSLCHLLPCLLVIRADGYHWGTARRIQRCICCGEEVAVKIPGPSLQKVTYPGH